MNKEQVKNAIDLWMQRLGFQSNVGAEIPNYRFSLQQFLGNKDTSELSKIITEIFPDWNPVEDVSIISPECAFYFLLIVLDTGGMSLENFVEQANAKQSSK